MKIATWNVNSIKVRLDQVLSWLQEHRPEVLCLQELKCEADRFPLAAVEEAGYQALVAGQKTYNGVALLSRTPGTDPLAGMPGFEDVQQRVIAATYGDTRVISVYCPNGESLTSDKYAYKLRWFGALREYLAAALRQYPKLVVAGDFNVAPEDRDVYDPVAWRGEVLCSDPERAAFDALLSVGLRDSFRLFEQAERSYSWWHYRVNAFKRDMGLRIDHILVSEALRPLCTACTIDKLPRAAERPSDHAPVLAEFSGSSSPSS
ncbi:MAG: exodeoxyribonuclease III [Betaproteobacteria bacterium]|nr:exodeoxyribonuclease III [Betaproteobacteria bacterium]